MLSSKASAFLSSMSHKVNVNLELQLEVSTCGNKPACSDVQDVLEA